MGRGGGGGYDRLSSYSNVRPRGGRRTGGGRREEGR